MVFPFQEVSMFASRLLFALALGFTGPAIAAGDWKVPDINQLPDDPYGQTVRHGRDLFEKTQSLIGPEVADPAQRYAGNNLACQSCHLQAGTQKFAIPMVGVFADFPQYRARENRVGPIEDRVNGCMERSMNGRALPLDSKEMRAFVSYLKFLSTGVPVGSKVQGRGPMAIKPIARAADPAKGKAVYAQLCAACHGADGQGVRRGVKGDGQGYAFPPLWGPDSYNDGAGMYRVMQAAAFVKGAMPLGVTADAPVLSDEQAFDVMAYVNSQPRPHKAGMELDFPARTNKPVDMPFPPFADGFSAEQHKFGPFGPIIEARKKQK